MNGRRVLAALVAIGLVVGAVAIRRSLDDTTASSNPSGDGGRLALLCTPETEAACRRLDASVTVEDPGLTVDRLATANGGLGADAWVTPRVWIDIAVERRTLAGLSDETPIARRTKVLATSPLALVIKNDVAATVTAGCAGKLDWACIARTIDRPAFRVGIDPTTTTQGLLSVAALTGGLLGRTDYASNDFDDETFVDGTTRIRGAIPVAGPGGSTALDRLLLIPATASAVTSVGAVARSAVKGSRDEATLTVSVPTPVVSAQVVAAGSRDGVGRVDDAALGEALGATGWVTGGAQGRAANGGVPRAGVVVALSDKWNG